MATSIESDVHRATRWSIALSVFLMIAGLLAVAAPFIAGLAYTLVVGWMLIVSGVLHLIFAWRATIDSCCLTWPRLVPEASAASDGAAASCWLWEIARWIR